MFNSSFIAALQIPRCSTKNAGVSLITKVSGNCQVTVVLQVPSISFPQRRSPREVRLSCSFEHMTRQLHDVAQGKKLALGGTGALLLILNGVGRRSGVLRGINSRGQSLTVGVPVMLFLGSTVDTVHASVFDGFGSIAHLLCLFADLGWSGRWLLGMFLNTARCTVRQRIHVHAKAFVAALEATPFSVCMVAEIGTFMFDRSQKSSSSRVSGCQWFSCPLHLCFSTILAFLGSIIWVITVVVSAVTSQGPRGSWLIFS